MNITPSLLRKAALCLFLGGSLVGVGSLVGFGSLASAHEGHEIDHELLASKIRERGHACASVTSAHEKSAKPMVMAVQCSDDKAYELLISDTGFKVTPTAKATTPGTKSH